MNFLKFYKKWGIYVLLLIEIIVFTLIAPGFMTWTNMMNVIRQVSMLGIVVTGVSIIMIGGGIDLSIGGQMATSGLIIAMLVINHGMNPFIASLIGIAVCVLMGAINGFLIVKLKIMDMVVTLGTMTILQGVAYLLTGGFAIFGMPENFKFIGQGYLGAVPVPVIIFLVIVLICSVVMDKTYFGRHIYALGGNKETARLAGINISKLKVLTYAIAGSLTGIASVIMLARTNSAQPAAGSTYAFDCMTASVLGGVSFAGGEGKIVGGVIGVIFIGILGNALVIMGISEYWQNVIKGIILILAVAMDNIQQKAKRAKAA